MILNRLFRRNKEQRELKITLRDVIKSIEAEGDELFPNIGKKEKVRMPQPHPEFLFIGVYRHNIKGPMHVFIRLPDRFRHVFICGATGVGKTSLLVNMILQDIYNGYGLCFIDPKGDAIEEILMRMPEHRMEDVILIDPANYDKVVGLNFLELPKKNMSEEQIDAMKEVVVADLVALMRQQTQIWGERFGRIFETLVRAILDFNERVSEDEQLTFLDLYVLLTDDEVRNKFAETVDDPIIREYLLKINEMPEDIMEPVIRRLNDWVMNKIARQIVTHRKSSFDFREVIDTNKIILVRIPKGEVGETIMQLVGTTVLSKMWAAAKSRVKLKPEERVPFFLYIDEFSNFAFEGSTFDEILSEARAFKLGLIIATQYPSQLSAKVREAVYSNCGTIISFNPQNPSDASILIKRFPGIKTEDLLSLGLYKAMVRVMVNNELTDPFVIQTYPPTQPLRSRDEIVEVTRISLERYGLERMSEMQLSEVLRRIKELCAVQPKAGLMNELLEILYAMVIKGIDVTYQTFSREAKKRGINIDERKFDSFKEVAERAGYITLKTDMSTGRSVVVPNPDRIKEAFWADKFGEITDGFVDHRRLIVRAYEYFTSLGYIAEIPKRGKLKAELGNYTPDLVLRVPPDEEDRLKCYKFFQMKEKIVVEVEVTTQTRPGQLLKKLARAYKAGYFLIYVVQGFGENEGEYISIAKQIVEIVENMRGRNGFYKTSEVERDRRGRKLWVNKHTKEIAYEQRGMLYSTRDNSYLCTVSEAKDKGWTLKCAEFDPAKEFKDTGIPRYGEACLVLIFPPEGFDFPVVRFAKGTSGYHLITIDCKREVTHELKELFRKGRAEQLDREMKLIDELARGMNLEVD